MRNSTVLATAIFFAAIPSIASAETWPTLEQYARECILIVHVKQVGDYSDERYAPLTLEVVETWVGHFDPRDFEKSKDGHIVASLGEHGMTLKQGQEAIVFYTRRNRPRGKILSHSTAFPITDDRIVYASTGHRPETLTVSEFRRRIEDARR